MNDFTGLLTTCDYLQAPCNVECWHCLWEVDGKRCDGIVCFKALFCESRELMRTQSVLLDYRLRFELVLCVYEGLLTTGA